MVLIFSSFDYPNDPQVDCVVRELGRRSMKALVINPFKMEQSGIELAQRGRELGLLHHEKQIHPSVVYLTARWRSDSLTNVPGTLKYPNVYRSQIDQFLQDLRFACDGLKWIPGKQESIERAESKPAMLALAAKLGIEVPSLTINSFVVKQSMGHRFFRKKLGFPFIVSINTRRGIEVGVTTTGSEVQIRNPIRSKSPWQWQESLRAIAHMRCCMVGRRVWAVASNHPSQFSTPRDFRELNEVNQQDFEWRETEMPQPIIRKLVALNRKLGISVSCPEFLLTKDGRSILIDLNPCGDWYGFFNEAKNKEIAHSIAQLICSSSR